jgi:hypothetical protein
LLNQDTWADGVVDRPIVYAAELLMTETVMTPALANKLARIAWAKVP